MKIRNKLKSTKKYLVISLLFIMLFPNAIYAGYVFNATPPIDIAGDSGDYGSAIDGTGQVPADATAWGYKPNEVPESLKKYILDPAQNGLTYGGPGGWFGHTGQCVDLTESLGAKIWETGHNGVMAFGNGIDQAASWARLFRK